MSNLEKFQIPTDGIHGCQVHISDLEDYDYWRKQADDNNYAMIFSYHVSKDDQIGVDHLDYDVYQIVPKIIFDEPVWTFDYEANVANPEVEKYLIKMKFSIDGEKGYMLGEMSESPRDNPELYQQKIQEMKDSLPGAYERGEIQEPPGIIEV